MIICSNKAIATDVIVIIAYLNKTTSCFQFTTNNVAIGSFILKLNNCRLLRNRQSYTIFIKEINFLFFSGICSAVDVTTVNITILIETVLNTVNFLNGQSPMTRVIIRTNIVAMISVNIKPLTCCNRACFTEIIQSSANHAIAGICFIIISKAIPSLFYLDPTVLNKNAIDSIITSAFKNVQTGSI